MEWNAQMRDGLIYAIGRDVTERVQAKELLQAEHERNDGIWDWDLAAGTVYLSPRWKEQLGYMDSELDSNQELFSGLLHPDDRERVRQVIADYLQQRLDLYDIEFRLRHKDGSYRWIRSRGKAFWGTDGVAYRMAGAHTDIEERKRQERQIELLSYHDQLTGLFNRHYYEKVVKEWSGSQRQDDSVSLIVADVNGL